MDLRAVAFGTFQEDSFEVHDTADGYSRNPRLLKSSRAKRTPPTWLQLPKPPRPIPAGHVHAAEQTSPELIDNFKITLYKHFFIEALTLTSK